MHKSKAHLRNYTKKDFAKSLDNTGVTYVKETLILSIKARDIFWASLNISSQIISHTPFHDTTFFYICVCIWTYSWGDFQRALGQERRSTLNVSGGLLWPGLLEYIMQSIRKPALSLLRLLTGASSVSRQPPLADASSHFDELSTRPRDEISSSCLKYLFVSYRNTATTKVIRHSWFSGDYASRSFCEIDLFSVIEHTKKPGIMDKLVSLTFA